MVKKLTNEVPIAMKIESLPTDPNALATFISTPAGSSVIQDKLTFTQQNNNSRNDDQRGALT